MQSDAPLPPAIPEPPVQPAREQIARANPRIRRSAQWFWWIAGLSAVNSIADHTRGSYHFFAGLGMTQVADALFRNLALVAYGLDLGIIGFFVIMGFFARDGAKWAFLVGGIVYALDAVIFGCVGDWLPVAFHAYALFWIYKGFAELKD